MTVVVELRPVRLAALVCALCGSGCVREGAVFGVRAGDGSEVRAWCSTICVGRHGIAPWRWAFPAVRSAAG